MVTVECRSDYRSSCRSGKSRDPETRDPRLNLRRSQHQPTRRNHGHQKQKVQCDPVGRLCDVIELRVLEEWLIAVWFLALPLRTTPLAAGKRRRSWLG